MTYLGDCNPLSFDEYINFGNTCQKFCLNEPSPNIVLRTGIGVCAKIAGRIQEVALHIILGSLKLTISSIVAICSVPAAAFDYTPNHYNLAKQGSLHIALAFFYALDIPFSFTNIANKYPQGLSEKIQQKFNVAFLDLLTEPLISKYNKRYQEISSSMNKEIKDQCQKSYQEYQVKKKNGTLTQKEQRLSLLEYLEQGIENRYRKPPNVRPIKAAITTS